MRPPERFRGWAGAVVPGTAPGGVPMAVAPWAAASCAPPCGCAPQPYAPPSGPYGEGPAVPAAAGARPPPGAPARDRAHGRPLGRGAWPASGPGAWPASGPGADAEAPVGGVGWCAGAVVPWSRAGASGVRPGAGRSAPADAAGVAGGAGVVGGRFGDAQGPRGPRPPGSCRGRPVPRGPVPSLPGRERPPVREPPAGRRGRTGPQCPRSRCSQLVSPRFPRLSTSSSGGGGRGGIVTRSVPSFSHSSSGHCKRDLCVHRVSLIYGHPG